MTKYERELYFGKKSSILHGLLARVFGATCVGLILVYGDEAVNKIADHFLKDQAGAVQTEKNSAPPQSGYTPK